MQLGARWGVGSSPHPGVPSVLHDGIRGAEAASDAAPGGSWTLTWLEGRPRVELVGAAGQLLADLRLTAQGLVVDAAAAGAAPHTADGFDDEDDDDWLN